MGGSLLGRGENAGGLDDIFSAAGSPRDFRRIHLIIDGDLFSVDDKLAVLRADLTVKTAVHRIVFGHINHIIGIDERIVDSHNLKFFGLCDRGAEHKPADAAKTINANFNCHWKQPPVFLIVLS